MQAKEEKEFTPQERHCLIVWIYVLKPLKQLRRYGLIYCASRKVKYMVTYTNEENAKNSMEKINQLHFVRSVGESYRLDAEMNFAEKIGTKAAYQEQENDSYVIEELPTEIRLAENI